MFNIRAVAMSNKMWDFKLLTGLFAAVLLVSACASDSAGPVAAGDVEISDPFEGTNRAVFSFNNVVDDAVIHPIVKGYNAVVPDQARTSVDNVFKNLRSPVNFANEVLQGDFDGAGNVVVRAVVNTLLGVGGLFDLAGYEGIQYESEDFGQTLATWGVGHGPYLVVPIIGPSSARDYIGYAVDSFADPLRWYLFNIDEEGIYYGKVGAEYLNLRASLVRVLEDLENSSIDYYAATRSAYYQRREALVNDRNVNSAPSINYDDY
jgi:phospholipid-binding lipoprotein MlaA